VQQAMPPVAIRPGDDANMSMAQRLFKQQQQPQAAQGAPALPPQQQPPQQQPPLASQQQAAMSSPPAAPQPQPQSQQPPASQPQLGISDPVIEKAAATAAQAHMLAMAPNMSDMPVSHPPHAAPVTQALNGLQHHADNAQQQQAPVQAPQQQTTPQHTSLAPGPQQTQGLGGIPVQPPPRQAPSFADSTGSGSLGNTWPARPQKPAQTAPGPNLGASLMASLGGGAGSGGLPQHTPPLSDPAIVSHSLGGSGGLVTLGGGQQEVAQPSPVVMPPAAQQQGDSGVDRVRLQFGQFGVGGEYGSGFSNAAAMPQQNSESQGPSFQQQATNFASTSYGSQPSSHTGHLRQDDQLSSSLTSNQGVAHPFQKSADAPSTVQQHGQQQTQQGDQQQQSTGAGMLHRPSTEQQPPQQQPAGQSATSMRTAAAGAGQYAGSGYDDMSGYGGQQSGYGQQYGGAFAQGQYDAFGGGGIGAGAGADKRSPSFDPGYGFQSSNLGTGYNPPQGKQDNLQSATSASSGFGTEVAAPNAAAGGGQGQGQLHQQGYGPPGMGGYGYGAQAAQYGYQAAGYGMAPPNYGYGYGPQAAGSYQGGYGTPQQQQGGYGAPGRPNKQQGQQQQQQQQQQQYAGYNSQGSSAYGGQKDGSGAGMGGGQGAPETTPYAGAAQAFHMQGPYSGYGTQQGRQQQGNFGGFGGYAGGGYGGYGHAPNGDAFKMQ
jgi:hypothetical protein